MGMDIFPVDRIVSSVLAICIVNGQLERIVIFVPIFWSEKVMG
jgi:hypothetical protein